MHKKWSSGYDMIPYIACFEVSGIIASKLKLICVLSAMDETAVGMTGM